MRISIGKWYWTDGIDIHGRRVTVRAKVVRLLNKCERDEKPMYDCVTESKLHVRILSHTSKLRDSR